MPYIRKGHTIVHADLTFVFKHRYIEVYADAKLLATIPVMDSNGLPNIGTEQDMQEAIDWFLFDNNALQSC